MPSERFSVRDKKKIICWYRDERMSIPEIAKKLTANIKTITKVLNQCDVKIDFSASRKGKPVGEYVNRMYQLNHSAFDNVMESADSAYFVGLLLTDGCLPVKTRDVREQGVLLSQAEPRHDLVYKFRAFLGTDKPVNFSHKEGQSPVHSLAITSRRIREVLMSYGVMPQKTGRQVVDVRLQGNRDFWRGVFDGDGCVMLQKRKGLFLYLGSTSPDLAMRWKEYCLTRVDGKDIQTREFKTQKGKQVWGHTITGLAALRIAESLYEGATTYCDVKYAVYQKAKHLAATTSV